MTKDILSPADIAQELNCSTQWITQLLRDNRLDGEKWGRQWIVTREALEKYKESQKARDSKK